MSQLIDFAPNTFEEAVKDIPDVEYGRGYVVALDENDNEVGGRHFGASSYETAFDHYFDTEHHSGFFCGYCVTDAEAMLDRLNKGEYSKDMAKPRKYRVVPTEEGKHLIQHYHWWAWIFGSPWLTDPKAPVFPNENLAHMYADPITTPPTTTSN